MSAKLRLQPRLTREEMEKLALQPGGIVESMPPGSLWMEKNAQEWVLVFPKGFVFMVVEHTLEGESYVYHTINVIGPDEKIVDFSFDAEDLKSRLWERWFVRKL